MNNTRESLHGIVSVIGRLLEELSWIGEDIRDYRNGGRGFENVLTAEVLQGLDFMPRGSFLGSVIAGAHGANHARAVLVKEIESAQLTVLPGNHYLIPSGLTHQTKMPVQPDALIESESVYAIVEAKRIRSSAFQPNQLAREYVLTLRDSGKKIPLLLLIVSKKPPLSVKRNGKMHVAEAVTMNLKETLLVAEEHSIEFDFAVSRIDDVLCWITWQEIHEIVVAQLAAFQNTDASVKSAVFRLAHSVTDSISWHG